MTSLLSPVPAEWRPCPNSHHGIMQRLGTGFFPRWRKWLFVLDKGTLTWYEPTERGRLRSETNLSTYVLLDEFPSHASDERISLRSASKPALRLRCESQEQRAQWVSALFEHLSYLREAARLKAISSLVAVSRLSAPRPAWLLGGDAEGPVECLGWLWKRGQVVRSIRRRFFSLAAGVLSYYAHDVTIRSQLAHRPRGSLRLSGYELRAGVVCADGRIEMLLVPGSGAASRRSLVLYCKDQEEQDKWARAIAQHVAVVPPIGPTAIA